MSIVFDQHLGKKSIMVLKGCGGVDLFFKVICIMALFWPREPASELSLLSYTRYRCRRKQMSR